MTVEFNFELSQKVRTPFDTIGRIKSNSIVVGCIDKRILVEYADKNGAIFSCWFDEKELTAIEK